MDDKGGEGGSFVAVRRISQGLDRGTACHSTGIFLFFPFRLVCYGVLYFFNYLLIDLSSLSHTYTY